MIDNLKLKLVSLANGKPEIKKIFLFGSISSACRRIQSAGNHPFVDVPHELI